MVKPGSLALVSDRYSERPAGTGDAQTAAVHLAERPGRGRDQGHPEHPGHVPRTRVPRPVTGPPPPGGRVQEAGRYDRLSRRPADTVAQDDAVTPPSVPRPVRLTGPIREDYLDASALRLPAVLAAPQRTVFHPKIPELDLQVPRTTPVICPSTNIGK